MNKERLLRLADHLDAIDPIKFDLTDWRCGTTACAIGHACDIPEFKEAGLKLAGVSYDSYPYADPCFLRECGWDAVVSFFDINYDDAEYLFEETAYDPVDKCNPKAVSNRIREFVNDFHDVIVGNVVGMNFT